MPMTKKNEDWNGDPDCPLCKGRGVVSTEYMGFPGGATASCDCRYAHDVKLNVERVWKGLFKARTIEDSPLLGLDKRNLVVTASQPDFRRHLRHTAIRKGPHWDARVVSDAALAQAWLATVVGVFDADVLRSRERGKVVSEDFVTLVDIAVPFDLLIIQLGVKAAKNREMPGVLLEVLHERGHRDLPTWLIESPAYPLTQGHICWDARIEDFLVGWPTITLSEEDSGFNSGYDQEQGGVQNFSMGSEEVPQGYEAHPERPTEDDIRRAAREPAEEEEEEEEIIEDEDENDWVNDIKLTKDTSKKSKSKWKGRGYQ